MKERPILFNAQMVRAVLDNRKKQTRRVVKWRDVRPGLNLQFSALTASAVGSAWVLESPTRASHEWRCAPTQCPYGTPGDRLWVREAWQHSSHPLGPYDAECIVHYRADYLDDPHGPDGEKSPEGRYRIWRPPIHMPRAASRIALEVTNVRVERVQSISAADALAEGIESADYLDRQEYLDCAAPAGAAGWPRPITEFQELWNSINAAHGHGWDANPWVWVVEFKRVGGNGAMTKKNQQIADARAADLQVGAPITSTISAVSFQGLSITTPDGEPATLAVIDMRGRIIDSGPGVMRAVWEVAIRSYRNFLIGSGLP